MIVRIHSAGKSFKGCAAYLTHDPDAKSADRVGWTHTLNLAHDDVASAVDEMLWTSRSAELLKQEAGIRAGGRASENAVKHVSLNWSPGETPTQAHMTETAEGFLRHMDWHEHQTLLVAHEDKEYFHVHVLLNTVHPETGLCLDDSFERRRAQKWALGYEMESGKVVCEQRLKEAHDREDAPTRPAWMAFKNKEMEFQEDENVRRNQAGVIEDQPHDPAAQASADWKKLKDMQRQERESFFAQGKMEFSELRRSIYGEVREEFRDRWADFYASQKNGADTMLAADLKKSLIAEQKEVLESRRDEACAELKDSRNVRYRELLDDQQDIRHQMRSRQESGFDNAIFLGIAGDRDVHNERPVPSFRTAAEESVARPPIEDDDDAAPSFTHRGEHHGLRPGINVGADVATGLGFGLLAIFGGIADGVTGSTPEVKPRRRIEAKPSFDLFDMAAEQARRQQREQEDASDEERRRQRSYGE